MATEIVMPKLSDTMTEGKFGVWKKVIGDPVQRGDVIAEVETDKAVMDLEAFTSGVLLETRVKTGDLVAVGTVIGIIGTPGETVAGAMVSEEKPAVAEPVQTVERGDVPERIWTQDAPESLDSASHDTDLRSGQAAPVVRRRARELGVDLTGMVGSGPGGRILLTDLERHAEHYAEVRTGRKDAEPAEAAREAAAPATQPAEPGSGEPVSRMRAAIARTVAEAWRTIPHFFVTVAIDMGEAEEVRREMKASGTPVSLNDMVVKGAAIALGKFPLVNASFRGDAIELHDAVNIGIAVSLPDGLLVPVIKGCERLSLKDIATQSRVLIQKARNGTISQTEISGGTFSVSNLGMYGIKQFTAVIHPPQAAILAVGAVSDRVTVKNGQPTTTRVMEITLSADHRLVDGAYAAKFLRELQHILENPVKMLL